MSGFSLLTGAYSEGTWTPVLTFATPGDLSVAYAANSQVGTYIKIGKLVIAAFNIATSTFTHTTASGALQVSGLPFASKNVAGDRHIAACWWSGITKASYTSIVADLSVGTTTMGFVASGSGVGSGAVAVADVPTGGTVILRAVVVYHAA